jgi:hypothetical protein
MVNQRQGLMDNITPDLCLYEYFHFLCGDDYDSTIDNIKSIYNINLKQAREVLAIGRSIYNNVYDKTPPIKY